jgi:hypothetical protein
MACRLAIWSASARAHQQDHFIAVVTPSQSSMMYSPPERRRGKRALNEARVSRRRCDASSLTRSSGIAPNSVAMMCKHRSISLVHGVVGLDGVLQRTRFDVLVERRGLVDRKLRPFFAMQGGDIPLRVSDGAELDVADCETVLRVPSHSGRSFRMLAGLVDAARRRKEGRRERFGRSCIPSGGLHVR